MGILRTSSEGPLGLGNLVRQEVFKPAQMVTDPNNGLSKGYSRIEFRGPRDLEDLRWDKVL